MAQGARTMTPQQYLRERRAELVTTVDAVSTRAIEGRAVLAFIDHLLTVFGQESVPARVEGGTNGEVQDAAAQSGVGG